MAKYLVKITEQLITTLVVEAESGNEAAQLVEDAYTNGDIILDADNFAGVNFLARSVKEDDDLSLYPKLQKGDE